MLTISKTQMEILRQAMRAEFIRTTAAMLRKAVPNFLARLDEATALARVEACVAKAESYGLSTERDIRDFIAVQTVAGESFDTDPRFVAAWEALTETTQPPTIRLGQTRERVAAVLAREHRT